MSGPTACLLRVDLEEGDLEEAFKAAEAVGDDRLQRRGGGSVNPDSFTHGTSAQRKKWFDEGYRDGQPDACDTFLSMSSKPLALLTLVTALALPSAAHAQADRTIAAATARRSPSRAQPPSAPTSRTEAGEPQCLAPPFSCDTTLIELKKPGLYTFNVDVPDTSDIDSYLYESDASGTKGKLLKEGAGFVGDDEVLAYDAEPGYVLFVGAYYLSLQTGFTVNGTFEAATTEPAPARTPATPAAANRLPEATITKLAKSAKASKIKSFTGTAKDADGKVARGRGRPRQARQRRQVHAAGRAREVRLDRQVHADEVPQGQGHDLVEVQAAQAPGQGQVRPLRPRDRRQGRRAGRLLARRRRRPSPFAEPRRSPA